MKHTHILWILLLLLPGVSATIQLENIKLDPAIIAAGDTVDLIIDYKTDAINDKRFGDENYEYRVELLTDDDQAAEHITITDKFGDDIFGTLRAGRSYSKAFSLKVDEQAPSGEYQLKLQGTWYKNGEAQEFVQSQRISIDVKREAITLGVASITSEPNRIRAGDRGIALEIGISNSGERDAQQVEITAELPEELLPASASGRRTYIGFIGSGEVETTTLHLDATEDLRAGEHEIRYTLNYKDDSQNSYTKIVSAPIYVNEKPRITARAEPVSITDEGVLVITVENTGDTAAEAIDIRLLKESNQPFVLDTRSGYVGRLEVGESATVHLPVQIEKHATPGEYNVPLLIRAKGDSERNDNEIYTSRSKSIITIHEDETNNYIAYAIGALVVIGGIMLWKTKK